MPNKGLEPKICDFGDRVLELRMSGELDPCVKKAQGDHAYSRLEDLAKQTPTDDI